MQDTVAKLFQRFVEKLPAEPDATLRAEKVQPADESSAAPWHTVLIHGRHDDEDKPLAVVLMTLPSHAPDDTAVLEFVVRRARAHKAPYFVTWTLRDAILWRTPKPGTPAARDSLEKLRDYSCSYYVLGHGKVERDITALVEHNIAQVMEILDFFTGYLAQGCAEAGELLTAMCARYGIQIRNIKQYFHWYPVLHAFLSHLSNTGQIKHRIKDNRLLWCAVERS